MLPYLSSKHASINKLHVLAMFFETVGCLTLPLIGSAGAQISIISFDDVYLYLSLHLFFNLSLSLSFFTYKE